MSTSARFRSGDLYFHRLGQITAGFSELEWLLADCLHMMATTFDDARITFDGRVKILFVGENFTKLLEKLDVIMKYCVTQKGMLKEYLAFSENLRKLKKQRNAYVHTHFWSVEKGHALRFKDSRSETKLGDFTARNKVTLKELDKLVQDIHDLKSSLNNWFLNNAHLIKEQFVAKVERNRQVYERRRGRISKYTGEQLPKIEWPPLAFDVTD